MSQESLLRLAGGLFRFSVLVGVLTGTFGLVFGSPAAIKKAADQSDIYEAAATFTKEQAIHLEIAPSIKPGLEQAAATTFTAPYLQSTAEQILDGSYNWLQGKADKPDFNIDATPAVTDFITKLGDQAVVYAEDLPPCTSAGQIRTELANADLLALKCLPPNTSPDMIRSETVNRVRSSNEFFQNPVVTADTLPKTRQGRAIYQQYAEAPTYFRLALFVPWLALVAALAAAVWVCKIYREPTKASRAVASGLFWTTLPVFAAAGLAHAAFITLAKPGGSITRWVDGSFQQYGVAFIRSLESSVAMTLLVISGSLAILGGIVMLVTRIIKSDASDFGLTPAADGSTAVETDKVAKKGRLRVKPAAPIGTTVTPSTDTAEVLPEHEATKDETPLVPDEDADSEPKAGDEKPAADKNK